MAQTSENNTKKSDDKKTMKEKTDQGSSGKLFVGVLVCVGVVEIIVLFLTLELSTGKLDIFITTTLWQAIFIVPLHFLTFVRSGMWSLMAALTIGAFIGGLIMKKIKKGVLLGTICFGILLFLQFAVGFLFNFNDLMIWYSLISLLGGNILVDFLVSIGILIAAGAIGGAITRD